VSFVFAGTPEFAAQVLGDLVERGRVPSLVVSQPSRAQGRGQKEASPPAVRKAEELGLPVVQAEDINDASVLGRMRETGASVLGVAAFGQLLRAPVLEAFDCLNVHASLLPRYRGAAPITRALQAGETETGVSIIRMMPGLDEGPWALQTRVSLSLRDDAASVGRILALLGAIGLDLVMTGLEDDTATWTEQEGEATYAPKIWTAEARIAGCRSALAVHNLVRALAPPPGARASAAGLEFKVWRTWPYGLPGLEEAPEIGATVAGRPGRIAVGRERYGRQPGRAPGRLGPPRLFLGCEAGVLEILELQPAGKNRMRVAEFLRGYGRRLGERLDEEDS
jgi:methionyl-tRNA formyltransferase